MMWSSSVKPQVEERRGEEREDAGSFRGIAGITASGVFATSNCLQLKVKLRFRFGLDGREPKQQIVRKKEERRGEEREDAD
ncbi:hypothetical protein CBR_g20093 [Chara braunii]|uniref:Uncharacterized protein n=1 Tax=Chara braunii TaxID=69332 RepID=A0A388KZQ1_CHABU|nr:hypothetical protein CBR_g20093 [Chara braunii]|eukprot:GBG75462.1 hypothetical protein CBR_g20093 [Chara braunii]